MGRNFGNFGLVGGFGNWGNSGWGGGWGRNSSAGNLGRGFGWLLGSGRRRLGRYCWWAVGGRGGVAGVLLGRIGWFVGHRLAAGNFGLGGRSLKVAVGGLSWFGDSGKNSGCCLGRNFHSPLRWVHLKLYLGLWGLQLTNVFLNLA